MDKIVVRYIAAGSINHHQLLNQYKMFFKQTGGKAAIVFPPCGNIMAVKAKPGMHFDIVIQLAANR
jgi:hypothetical protein